MTYSKSNIINSLKHMGLKEGDICVVRAALREIGDIEGKRSLTVLDALLETVTDKGTIIALSFTNLYKLPLSPKNKKNIFTIKTPPYTGGFVLECLSRTNTVRSKHPSNSFCAIGKDAVDILKHHDEKSSSFEPIGEVINKNGKMLLIGNLYDAPGFTSVHWAQWLLGLSTQSKLQGQYGIKYIDVNGEQKLFVRKDFGGCSKGFAKFYNYYKEAGILSEGKIGDADCLLINLKDALAIELPLIKANPNFPLCENPACQSCRISWKFSDTSSTMFLVRNPKLILSSIIKKIRVKHS